MKKLMASPYRLETEWRSDLQENRFHYVGVISRWALHSNILTDPNIQIFSWRGLVLPLRHAPLTAQLERSATVPSLAASAERLVSAPDCRGLGRQRRRGQPGDAARTRRRPRGPAPSAAPWCSAPVVRRPARAPARAVAPRRRSLWLPGAGRDLRPDRRRDAPGVWRLLSSRPCRPLTKSAALEPPKARTASATARRNGHHPLAGGEPACSQKGAQAQGHTILFLDASGCSPWPSVVRTYAPVGQTPILREWWTRDPLSAISAIAPAGKLYFHCQDQAIYSAAVIACLEHLLREVPGPLVLMWDGAPIHRSHLLQAFLANSATPRLRVERLPASAPELHPGEGLWAHLKGVELRHRCCCTIRHLRHELCDAVKRVRRKPRMIQGCFRGAKL
jgi:transposase